MATTLIAALVVGLLSPIARSLAWGVPFSLLSIGTVLTSFAGSSLTVLIIGAICSVALSATPLSADQIDLWSGLIAAATGSGLLASSIRRLREVRGLSVLCQRLPEKDARELALRSLRRLLDRVRRTNVQQHASLVLMATGPLTQAALWNEAREQLMSVAEDALDAPQAVLRDQALATCHLQFDDPKAAQEAIERIPRPAEPSIEVWLVAMEALLLAVGGRFAEAEATLREQDAADNPSLEASHRLVRAHIWAGQGRKQDALRELDGLRLAAGRAGLERVLRPHGPASILARELLDEDTRAASA